MSLKAKPIKAYRIPSYPDMEKASLNPDLLKKLPECWRYNKAVITAILALSSLSLAGCNEKTQPAQEGSTTLSEIESGKIASSDQVYTVAPIFEHGRGTGSLGCEVVAPPAYMSEQEAMAIIKNEALKAGINLEAIPDKYTVEAHGKVGSEVSLEVYDKEKGIAVSFISIDESIVNEGEAISTPSGTIYTYSTVSRHDTLKRAKDAVEDWSKMDIPYVVGTFYEPGYEANTEEDLRAQVRDFIEWLRGQGVI